MKPLVAAIPTFWFKRSSPTGKLLCDCNGNVIGIVGAALKTNVSWRVCQVHSSSLFFFEVEVLRKTEIAREHDFTIEMIYTAGGSR